MHNPIERPQQSGDRRHIGNVPPSVISLLIHDVIDKDRINLIITKDTQSAQRIFKECQALETCEDVWYFPDWETLPYDYFSPHQDIVSERLALLNQLHTRQHGVIVIAASTLMQRIAPPAFITGSVWQLKVHDHWDPIGERTKLMQSGYQSVTQVMQHGEFAIRGSIVDLFPMGSAHPYRLDLFDDQIDSIAIFDIETQRSTREVSEINCLPAHEFPIDEAAIKHFQQQWHHHFDDRSNQSPVLEAITAGHTTAGIEYYLALFFNETTTLLDHLPLNTLIIHTDNTYDAAQTQWQSIQSRYESRRYDLNYPCLAPLEVFYSPEQLQQQLQTFAQIQCHTQALNKTGKGRYQWQAQSLPDVTIHSQDKNPYRALKQLIEQADRPIVLCAKSRGRREILREHLAKLPVKAQLIDHWQDWQQQQPVISLMVLALEHGAILGNPNVIIITENDLFKHKVPQARRKSHETDQTEQTVGLRDLTELNIGDAVVHIEHGIGRYLGLARLDMGGSDNEFVTIEYANQDKLYVPVRSLHLISRYSSGDIEHAPINQLGTDRWAKTKERAAKRVFDVAAELIEIQAKRISRNGFKHHYDVSEYERFASQFAFEETPDQQTAIDAVLHDLRCAQPMDRLLCGDVGFGKTEVAMRAAFAAVQSNKQVAMLVPTTLLAQQHYDNFVDRFADWPVNIALLSRFQSTKQTQQTLAGLAQGKIDIVIGTHKLLSPSMNFKALGLVIIDEEHRFGVRHKEQLKKLRAQVDMLTMTATPIPRTLNLSLSSIRDLSIIATAPAKRLSVMTFVKEKQDTLIKEAILREIFRGGQVYYLHNNVQSIDHCAQTLANLLPEVRINIAHGQMRERELEQRMADFYHNRFQVLVCTTIIETGIDVPNANTIIIEHADRFGLAQLHQLRGRVGRSHHQAYAYLMTPPLDGLTKDAQKRLEAIEQASDLGAGFQLANHDMEIRGAGEILGDEQSGNMHSIGFELYLEFVDKAISALKQGKQIDLDQATTEGCEVELRISTLIPDDYLGDVSLRLKFYKGIANAQNEHTLNDIQAELIDRFGPLPQPTQHLFACAQLRLQGRALGITKIEAHSQGGNLHFIEPPPIDAMTLIKLVQVYPQSYQLAGPTKLAFKGELLQAPARIDFTFELIDKLRGYPER